MMLVVKVGGELIGDPRLEALARDIAALAGAHHLAVVHGGGPQATALSKRLGLEPRLIGGRRVTDRATLDVMKAALGQCNVDLAGALRAAGARPVGLGGAIEAVRRPPKVIAGGGPEPVDLGWVGDVVGIDQALLERLMGEGYVPVLPSLGVGQDGAVYNINADVVANRLAVRLGADVLVLVTGVDGVCRDVNAPATRIPELTVTEGRRAIADGTVAGGMIPKLEEAFAALAEGVRRILIVGGGLRRAIEQPGSGGTLLLP